MWENQGRAGSRKIPDTHVEATIVGKVDVRTLRLVERRLGKCAFCCALRPGANGGTVSNAARGRLTEMPF